MRCSTAQRCRWSTPPWLCGTDGRFAKLGAREITCPGMYHNEVRLDRAENIGGYRSPTSPREPALVRMTRTPCEPGLPEREQHRAGRIELLTTSFETFERSIRDQLARVLGGRRVRTAAIRPPPSAGRTGARRPATPRAGRLETPAGPAPAPATRAVLPD